MASTGVTSDSVGGIVKAPEGHSSQTSTLPQGERTNADYGAVGPSVDIANNVEKSHGETKENQSGVKGLVNKITDKLTPSHEKHNQQQRDTVAESANHLPTGDPTRHKQANADLNRE